MPEMKDGDKFLQQLRLKALKETNERRQRIKEIIKVLYFYGGNMPIKPEDEKLEKECREFKKHMELVTRAIQWQAIKEITRPYVVIQLYPYTRN